MQYLLISTVCEQGCPGVQIDKSTSWTLRNPGRPPGLLCHKDFFMETQKVTLYLGPGAF